MNVRFRLHYGNATSELWQGLLCLAGIAWPRHGRYAEPELIS
jgi:hypothetical protein